MPRVTRLQRSRRRPGWSELHLDGAFRCLLPRRGLKEAGLEVGAELSEADLAVLTDTLHQQGAYDGALRYLSYRPRSRFEMERHLRSRGYSAKAVAAAIERCVGSGYLDDREFARMYAVDRIRLRPRSEALIEVELRRKGVSPEDARHGVMRAFEEEGVTEEELARRTAEKGLASFAASDLTSSRTRLYAYLGRRGFRRDAAFEAVEAALRERFGDERPEDENRKTHGSE
jgi:regulatory protein